MKGNRRNREWEWQVNGRGGMNESRNKSGLTSEVYPSPTWQTSEV